MSSMRWKWLVGARIVVLVMWQCNLACAVISIEEVSAAVEALVKPKGLDGGFQRDDVFYFQELDAIGGELAKLQKVARYRVISEDAKSNSGEVEEAKAFLEGNREAVKNTEAFLKRMRELVEAMVKDCKRRTKLGTQSKEEEEEQAGVARKAPVLYRFKFTEEYIGGYVFVGSVIDGDSSSSIGQKLMAFLEEPDYLKEMVKALAEEAPVGVETHFLQSNKRVMKPIFSEFTNQYCCVKYGRRPFSKSPATIAFAMVAPQQQQQDPYVHTHFHHIAQQPADGVHVIDLQKLLDDGTPVAGLKKLLGEKHS